MALTNTKDTIIMTQGVRSREVSEQRIEAIEQDIKKRPNRNF